MQGTIVINADAGRALRKKRAALMAMDVLGCSGDFCAGDKVYVVVRGVDGGQGVVATGIVRCDAAQLRQTMGVSTAAGEIPGENDRPAVVISEQDMQLLWPPAL